MYGGTFKQSKNDFMQDNWVEQLIHIGDGDFLGMVTLGVGRDRKAGKSKSQALRWRIAFWERTYDSLERQG